MARYVSSPERLPCGALISRILVWSYFVGRHSCVHRDPLVLQQAKFHTAVTVSLGVRCIVLLDKVRDRWVSLTKCQLSIGWQENTRLWFRRLYASASTIPNKDVLRLPAT
jgi:hypothetical protein